VEQPGARNGALFIVDPPEDSPPEVEGDMCASTTGVVRDSGSSPDAKQRCIRCKQTASPVPESY
jgi:hypothetical protein